MIVLLVDFDDEIVGALLGQRRPDSNNFDLWLLEFSRFVLATFDYNRVAISQTLLSNENF